MLLLTMSSQKDPYSFCYVDEQRWEVAGKELGVPVIGACRAGQSLYYFASGSCLMRTSLDGRGYAIPTAAHQLGLFSDGAHSIIHLGDNDFAYAASGLNEVHHVSLVENKPGPVVTRASITGEVGFDYSHFNGLCRDPQGWWYLSMLAWHRPDQERWRDRERLGLIYRCQDLFAPDRGQIDILRAGLAFPHSLKWHDDELWFCESKASAVWKGHERISFPTAGGWILRGLEIVGPHMYVGASPLDTPDCPNSSRLYRCELASYRKDYLDLAGEVATYDIYDIIKTA